MKLAKQISFLALAAIMLTGCQDKSKDGTIEDGTVKDSTMTDSTMTKSTAANLETASFKIEGMTCPMGCAATIEKKLAGMDGVENAKVDYEKKTAKVSFDASKQTAETLVNTVEKIADGAYKVSDVKSSGDKAYFNAGQEPAKKKKADKKSKDAKKCCAADAKGKDAKGCCAADGKKAEPAKGGSL